MKKIFLLVLVILILSYFINIQKYDNFQSNGWNLSQKDIEFMKKINQIEPLDKLNFSDKINIMYSFYNSTCDVPFEDALINKIHIKKYGKNFEINCERGPSYEDLYYTHPGKYENCTKELAEKIDRILKSDTSDYSDEEGPIILKEKENCFVPMCDVLPDSVNDYYLFVFDCTRCSCSDPNSWWAKCLDMNSVPIEERHRTPFFVTDSKKHELYA